MTGCDPMNQGSTSKRNHSIFPLDAGSIGLGSVLYSSRLPIDRARYMQASVCIAAFRRLSRRLRIAQRSARAQSPPVDKFIETALLLENISSKSSSAFECTKLQYFDVCYCHSHSQSSGF